MKASIISSSIHHLILPPTPTFKVSFFERIIFDFFIIKNHNVTNDLKILLFFFKKSFIPLGQWYFNYDLFKNELLKLKLPNQEFIFTLKE